MSSLYHDGLNFYYQETGAGVPFVFQHGLGGDVRQPFSVFQPPAGFRLLGLDCRAHGQTRPLGDATRVKLACFAEDLKVWLDHLGLSRVIVGGISMGAAVALNFTLRFPAQVLGLVLSRPAWLDGPNLENAKLFSVVARLIREHGAMKGRQVFTRSELYAALVRESPDCALSLALQFAEPRAEEAVVRLEQLPLDAPNHNRAEWSQVRVPTLVLASRQDPIHPFEYGQSLARLIPQAVFRELTPKSVSLEKYMQETQNDIADFLKTHFPAR